MANQLKLSPQPFRQYSRHELPENYTLEDYESEDDVWIKRGSRFHNLKDFCTVGAPIIPMPRGNAQVAYGDFAIAGWNGEIWGVWTKQDGISLRQLNKSRR